ncbi:hypothetical protein DL98DRAFT_586960 [Cadophora sp. DSE1049]|nr:hypothetical protein DL98DRAFT_586960 [Cadophora sp. DSE1049]
MDCANPSLMPASLPGRFCMVGNTGDFNFKQAALLSCCGAENSQISSDGLHTICWISPEGMDVSALKSCLIGKMGEDGYQNLRILCDDEPMLEDRPKELSLSLSMASPKLELRHETQSEGSEPNHTSTEIHETHTDDSTVTHGSHTHTEIEPDHTSTDAHSEHTTDAESSHSHAATPTTPLTVATTSAVPGAASTDHATMSHSHSGGAVTTAPPKTSGVSLTTWASVPATTSASEATGRTRPSNFAAVAMIVFLFFGVWTC